MQRRAMLASLGMGLATTAGCLSRVRSIVSSPPEPTPPAPGNWPEFGADAANTNLHRGVTGPEPNPEVAWTTPTGTPTANASPVVVDGTVIVPGTGDPGTVRALDAATGAEQWSFTPHKWCAAAPVVADGTVFLGGDRWSVYALDAADGQREWVTSLGGHSVGDGGLVVAGDTVFVVGQNAAFALETATGDVRWSRDFGDVLIETAPAYAAGRLVFSTADGPIYALDVRQGRTAWTTALAPKEQVLASPAISDGLVYVGLHGPGRLLALDTATGERRWAADLAGPSVRVSPVVADDVVLVTSARRTGGVPLDESDETATDNGEGESKAQGYLQAFDAGTGTHRWTSTTAGERTDLRSAPSSDGDTVYFGRDQGIAAVALADGTRRWQLHPFEEYVATSPAIAERRLFLGTGNGRVYAIG